MRKMSLALTAGLFLVVTNAVQAQSYDFVIDQKASSTNLDIGVNVPFSGTLIGNYDAETNPDGTQTRLGLFGGSGNEAVDYSASFDLGGNNQTSPSGDFALDVDRSTGTALISGLTLDILGGVAQQLDSTLTINFSTFRSINPDSVFFGGFDIPVPLGSIDLLLLSLNQTEESTLVITDDGEGNSTLTGLVVGEVTIQVVVLEQDFGTFALPAVFPFQAGLVENDNGASLLIESSLDLDQSIPAAEEPFEPLPFDLPTILPPGNFASILVNGTTGEGTVSGAFTLVMSADADAPSCADDPDINGDGVVDGTDLTLLLGSWNAPGGPSDINCDDIVDGTDLTLLLGSWTS